MGAEGQSAEVVVLRRNENKLALRIGEQVGQAMALDSGVVWNGTFYPIVPAPALSVETGARHSGDSGLESPMPGTLIKVLVSENESVAEGPPLVIMEAMKMEHTIVAPYAGRITRLPYAQGAQVAGGVALVELEPAE